MVLSVSLLGLYRNFLSLLWRDIRILSGLELLTELKCTRLVYIGVTLWVAK